MYTTCATCTKLLCHSCRVLVLELTVCVTYAIISVLVLLVCATYAAAISVSASVRYSANTDLCDRTLVSVVEFANVRSLYLLWFLCRSVYYTRTESKVVQKLLQSGFGRLCLRSHNLRCFARS